MKPRYVMWAFAALITYQIANALRNVFQGRWDWVAFDLACTAVVVASMLVSSRALGGIRNLDHERDQTIGHYKLMLDEMRREGNEGGEQYALTMLAIYGWKGDRDGQGDGGLSS